jgi:predicted enzyme related to lactoylglutathione lyase
MRFSVPSVLTPVLSPCLWLTVFAVAGCRPATPSIQLIELQVTDIERAVAFYRDVFGWEASRPDTSYALLATEPVPLGLALQDSVQPGGAMLVIVTEDLELLRDRVVEYGGMLRQPIAPSWRGRQFRFSDLDGNDIVVWSDAITQAAAPEPR